VTALLAAVAAAGISGIVAFAIYSFHTLRAYFTGLRSEVAGLREEMRQGFAELRAEIARLDRARS
jgi:hypothetical protein